MRTQQVQGCENMHIIDIEMFDTTGVLSPYLLTGETTVLFDTGTATCSKNLIKGIENAGVNPQSLDFAFLSHLHLDHIGGINELKKHCPNTTFLTNEFVYDKITDADALSEFLDRAKWVLDDKFDAYGSVDPISKSRLQVIQGGDRLVIDEHEFYIIDSPGHTSNHTAVYHVDSGCLYAGDALGLTRNNQLYPMSPPPYFNLDENLRTIEKFRERNPEKLLFAHSGVRDDPETVFDTYAQKLTNWVKRVDEVTTSPNENQDLLRPGSLPPTERDVLGAKMYLGKAEPPADIPI